MSKTYEILPKWRNLAKSDHTGFEALERFAINQDNEDNMNTVQ